jgi:hypothetical protein
MITLMVGAIVLLFFILLARAQHLARLDQPATPTPESSIHRFVAAHEPVIIVRDGTTTTHVVVILARA